VSMRKKSWKGNKNVRPMIKSMYVMRVAGLIYSQNHSRPRKSPMLCA